MPASLRTHEDERASATSVRWRVAEIAPDAQTARLVPYLPTHVLTSILDETFGSAAWANRFVPFGQTAVIAELTIEGLTKSAVVRGVGGAGHPEAWAAAALHAAATLHGIELPVDPFDEAWVEWDAEANAPRGWPDEDMTQSEPSHASLDADPIRRAPPEHRVAGEPTSQGTPVTGPIRSEGQQAIDKLMDRLRDAGQGLEAAKLVNEHRGYGSDPDEARALYARLRQLLLEGSTS